MAHNIIENKDEKYSVGDGFVLITIGNISLQIAPFHFHCSFTHFKFNFTSRHFSEKTNVIEVMWPMIWPNHIHFQLLIKIKDFCRDERSVSTEIFIILVWLGWMNILLGAYISNTLLTSTTNLLWNVYCFTSKFSHGFRLEHGVRQKRPHCKV